MSLTFLLPSLLSPHPSAFCYSPSTGEESTHSFTRTECASLRSGPTRVVDTKRRSRLSHTVGKKFRRMVKSRRPVRHQITVNHQSWCRRASSTEANSDQTKKSAVTSCNTSTSTAHSLEASKNSSDPVLASGSRSTRSISVHGFQLRTVPPSARSHKRPDKGASQPTEAPLPTSNQCHTEDGHAIAKLNTFPSLRHLSQTRCAISCHTDVNRYCLEIGWRTWLSVFSMRITALFSSAVGSGLWTGSQRPPGRILGRNLQCC